MKTLKTIDFKNKRALIRVDFNVPLDKTTYEINDDTRMRAAIPSIQYVIDQGGSVVLMSHLGRPKEGPDEKYSLNHIVDHLSKLMNKKVLFVEDCISQKAFDLSSSLPNGEILLLENLRFYKEEEKGDLSFAEKLSKHGDIYVNDAFGTAHRAHASTAIIANYFPNNKCFGFLMEAEIENIEKVLNNGEKPICAIIGGAKVSSKISIIEHLMDKVNSIIIGGGMAFTFIKAKGGEVGASLIEEDQLHKALQILEIAKEKNVKILLPIDCVIADRFDNNASKKTVDINQIPNSWMGLDISEKTIKLFNEEIMKSKTILWNGPMGVFEMDSFSFGTKSIALSLVEATKKEAFTLVGGGDSVSAINQYNLADQISYISTGGGAMLEYLEGIELPGIKAINQK
ncbi:MAG: phosphoglycerate kinase [Flavobacteriia bacterium]|nr:phosphoglycerate kinase [Flavobacteriia bacterium]